MKEEERRAYGVDAIATPSSKVMGGKVDNDNDDRRSIGGRRGDAMACAGMRCGSETGLCATSFESTSDSETFLYDAHYLNGRTAAYRSTEPGEKESNSFACVPPAGGGRLYRAIT